MLIPESADRTSGSEANSGGGGLNDPHPAMASATNTPLQSQDIHTADTACMITNLLAYDSSSSRMDCPILA